MEGSLSEVSFAKVVHTSLLKIEKQTQCVLLFYIDKSPLYIILHLYGVIWIFIILKGKYTPTSKNPSNLARKIGSTLVQCASPGDRIPSCFSIGHPSFPWFIHTEGIPFPHSYDLGHVGFVGCLVEFTGQVPSVKS